MARPEASWECLPGNKGVLPRPGPPSTSQPMRPPGGPPNMPGLPPGAPPGVPQGRPPSLPPGAPPPSCRATSYGPAPIWTPSRSPTTGGTLPPSGTPNPAPPPSAQKIRLSHPVLSNLVPPPPTR
ncbi:Hypp9265 [Branchiostoma lanceolatum]|uniref:Hypp9265 protein n=1 Tax=Branchiostoma lanceolatum TaxID=7740 RepID=A0A8K0EI77_BRALA|nr:Hypp9265 [Branchiostoma lanceolatum]